MPIEFYKYQGTGNDFILINNFSGDFDQTDPKLIQRMCDRKFGIGSDGLMVLEKSNAADFKLTFFNPDASLSFCGNGSRCAVRFARDQQLVNSDKISFDAFDGIHHAIISGEQIAITMRDVEQIRQDENGYFVNTGAPHVVVTGKQLAGLEIIQEGRLIRYNKNYSPVGTNVNFIEEKPDGIRLRTYEKGVEDETLSCGTGVTAAALVYAFLHPQVKEVKVESRGGGLLVKFSRVQNGFNAVELIGPAQFVYKGEYNG